ncbi:MAG: hypothetical protein ACRDRT_09190 [Pseudonocardiaceae bacterium]
MGGRGLLWLLWAAVSLTLVSACGGAPPAAAKKADPAARVEPLAGTDFKLLVLTARAVEQIGITTVPVGISPGGPGGSERRTVPAGAVLYQANGATLVYTNPSSLVFVSQLVTVESMAGDVATLSVGPDAGTAVVNVGAAELLGVEFGVGK